MIILFDEHETQFTSLGLGVLKDATKCNVREVLNGEFELEMSYDISGSHYNLIRENRIIFTEPNPWTEAQPFRIDSISRPINGIVEITAKHISYDLNYIPYKVVDAKTLAELLDQIQNGKIVKDDFGNNKKENLSLIAHNFKFTTSINSSGTTFKTTGPSNMRAMLMGDDEKSIIAVYKAELEFNKFNVNLLPKRGKNRGAEVRYGHNMVDLKHETSCDKLYNGVFPYYHKETTKNEQTTEESFKKVYIVGTKPLQDGWLSFVEGGEPYHPIDTTPVQVATQGDYFDKVYVWNIDNQYYEEKLYNQTVTLIENAITPEWIRIDWSSFPNVRCVANARGYFKTMTDTEWGELKGVGDLIFEGNILKQGISGIATNMIIFFAEVIPVNKESTNEEVTEIIDVQLDDPIIWINTPDAKTMTHNKILSLDLSSEFDEEPSQEKLKQKAEEYISKNKVGSLYITTEVSFVEVESNPYIYKNFNHIELGDTVHVVYADLGVDCELRVISTDYDPIRQQYEKVELGVKPDTLSTQSIENGDNISSLTNDVSYTDVTTVNKLIAKIVNADFVNAANANLSRAQIEELQVSKFSCPGIIEASQYVIDTLVAKLLTADNAEIKETLKAGTVEIKGHLDIENGSISIHSPEVEGQETVTYFTVDNRGHVECNDINITGGGISIGEDDNFTVDNDGNVVCKSIEISGTSKINIDSEEDLNILYRSEITDCRFTTINFCDEGEPSVAIATLRGVYEGGEDLTATLTFEVVLRSVIPTNQYEIYVTSDTTFDRDVSLQIEIVRTNAKGEEKSAVKSISAKKYIADERTKIFEYIAPPFTKAKEIRLLDPEPVSGSNNVYTIKLTGFVNPRIECDSHITPSEIHDEINLGLPTLRWHTVYTETSVNVASDKKLKKMIEYDISKYDSFFDSLKPCFFKLKNGTSDRYHMGMIAQDVEKALVDNNLTTQDFAGITKSIKKESIDKPASKLRDKDYEYGLRYEEFISLLIYEVQKLKQEIEELKEGGNQDV